MLNTLLSTLWGSFTFNCSFNYFSFTQSYARCDFYKLLTRWPWQEKKIEQIGKLVKSFLDKFPGLIGVLSFRGRQLSMKDLRHSSRKNWTLWKFSSLLVIPSAQRAKSEWKHECDSLAECLMDTMDQRVLYWQDVLAIQFNNTNDLKSNIKKLRK